MSVRFRVRGFPGWAAALFWCAVLPSASHASLIWESNYGTQITPSSFSPDPANGLLTKNLDFTLPFEGGSYGAITIATSGFLWLGGSNTAQCCVVDNQADALQYFEQGPARIAPVWYDLRPDVGGAVYFNDITDPDGSKRAVITYLVVPPDTLDQNFATFQVQLLSSGMLILSYLQFDSTSLGLSDPAALLGLTSAGNPSPVNIDFASLTSGSPVFTKSSSIYDYVQASDHFSLSGTSVVFRPLQNGGWQIGPDVFTATVPEPSTLIPAGGFIFLLAMSRMRQKRALPGR